MNALVLALLMAINFVSVNGAKGDGVTDDTAAIQRALDVAADYAAPVQLGAGTFAISDTLIIPNRVVLNGVGRGNGPGGLPTGTVIAALPSFPVSTPLVQLAAGDAQAFGCRAQNLCIHCNAIAGSIGVKSAVAQESSGLTRVTIRGYMATGVDFTDTDSTLFNGNYLLSEVEILPHASATGTSGFVWVSRNGAWGTLQRVSINHFLTNQAVGINVSSDITGRGNLLILGANIERHTDGILVDANSFVVASGIGGYGGGTNLIRIESGARVVLNGVFKNSAYTNTIQDNIAGLTITDQSVDTYAAGVATTVTPVVTLTDAATISTNAITSKVFKVTLAASRTVGVPSNARSGQRITYTVAQDGTGGWTLAWNAVFKQSWSDTGNTAGLRSTISFVYDGTNWNQDGAQTPYV